MRHALSTLGLVEDDGTDMKVIVDPWRDFARLSTPGRLATTWAAAAGLGVDAGCMLQTTLASVEPGYALRESHLLQLMEVAAGECGPRAGAGGAPPAAGSEPGTPDSTGTSVLEALCELGVFFDGGDSRYAPRVAARSALAPGGGEGGAEGRRRRR